MVEVKHRIQTLVHVARHPIELDTWKFLRKTLDRMRLDRFDRRNICFHIVPAQGKGRP